MRAWLGIASVLFFIPGARAQTPRPSFEAASIRENTASDRPVWTPERSGTHAILHRVPLDVVINYAWHIDSSWQIAFPPNMPEPFYDIEAVSESVPDEDQLRLMFQSLLEDRFRLKTHYEARQIDQYDLVVSKPGKLKPADPELTMTISGRPMSPGIAAITRAADGRHLVSSGCSIAQIAESFGRILHAPVTDKTNLEGTWSYNILLEEDPPNILPVIDRELGLKLEKSKGSARILIVDHVERPTPN